PRHRDRRRVRALHAATARLRRARGAAPPAARGRRDDSRARGRPDRPRGSVPARHGAQRMSGFGTLLYKELLRFWKVSFQTVAAPVLTSLLYLFVFAQTLEGRVRVYEGVPYTAFLLPGLVM